MVTTLPQPEAGRHRTDQRPGARAPHRSGRGRHVAAPDHARRRRIIGLGAVTVATVAALPVVTSPQLAAITSRAWEGLSTSTGAAPGAVEAGGASPGPVSGSAPAGGTTGSVEPSPGTGAHRAEDRAEDRAENPEPSAAPAPEPSSASPSAPAPEPSETPVPDPPPEPALTATYRVVWGDTLSTIGADHGMTWREVHEANADVIGPNPNLVVVGTVLKVLPA